MGKQLLGFFSPYSSVSFRARDILGTSLFPPTLGGTGASSGLAFLWKLCRLRTEKGKCQALYLRPVYGRRDSRLHQTHALHQLPRKASCDVWGDGWSTWGQQHRGLRNEGGAEGRICRGDRELLCSSGKRDHLTFPTSRAYPCCLSKKQGGTSCGWPQGGEQEGLGQTWSCSELRAGNPISEHISVKAERSIPHPSSFTPPCSQLQTAYVQFWG